MPPTDRDEQHDRAYPAQWAAVIAAIETSATQINSRLDHMGAEFAKLSDVSQATARTVGQLEERDRSREKTIGDHEQRVRVAEATVASLKGSLDATEKELKELKETVKPMDKMLQKAAGIAIAVGSITTLALEALDLFHRSK